MFWSNDEECGFSCTSADIRFGEPSLYMEERDPTPFDLHKDDFYIHIGDIWINEISRDMFILVGIREEKGEWKPCDSLPSGEFYIKEW